MEHNTLPKWEKVLTRNFPPLAWTSGAYYEFKGLPIGPLKWSRGREMQVMYKTVQSWMIQNPSAYYISNVNEVIADTNKDFEIAVDSYNKQVFEMVRVSAGTSLNDLRELSDKHVLSYGVMLVAFDIAIDIKNKITEIVPTITEELESYLATPFEQTAVERERTEMSNTTDFEMLANEFGFLHQDYLGKPWTANDYKQAVNSNATTVSHMQANFDVSTYSSYEQWLMVMFKKITYMYEEGRNAMVRCVWAMKQTVAQLGYNPDHMLYMTLGELENFTTTGESFIDATTVAARKQAFALYFEGNEYHEYTGLTEVLQLIQDQHVEYMWSEESNNDTSLKGSIAFKGFVTGKVRLVFNQEDANNVQEGEILIAPMTQVEFLSGIRKCGAIVTDEGGIICHAAIVSREFGKPCILATQKATKVFKTGDIVTVDANTGVVFLTK